MSLMPSRRPQSGSDTISQADPVSSGATGFQRSRTSEPATASETTSGSGVAIAAGAGEPRLGFAHLARAALVVVAPGWRRRRATAIPGPRPPLRGADDESRAPQRDLAHEATEYRPARRDQQ